MGDKLPATMKSEFFIAMWVFLLISATVIAQPRDQGVPAPSTGLQFEYAYQLSVSGDDARDKKQYPAALVLYEEASKEYKRLIANFPDWQPGISRFRNDYCKQERNIILDKTGLTVSNAIASVASDFMDKRLPATRPISGSGARLSESRMPKLKSDARQLIKAGKSEQARGLLMGALKIAPDDESLRLMISVAQCQEGQFKDAVYILEGLISESPSLANAHLVLGTAYLGLGDMRSARSSIERAIEINPLSQEGHYNLSRMMLADKKPDLESAEHHYRQSLKLGAEPDLDLEAILLNPSGQTPAPRASKR
jgi:tetratricopeptide (TPR) repeat protein